MSFLSIALKIILAIAFFVYIIITAFQSVKVALASVTYVVNSSKGLNCVKNLKSYIEMYLYNE